ncbi:MAG: cyclase family protein [Bacilli bacterium]|nr:cyclase family protein [Bacilli bacterium]
MIYDISQEVFSGAVYPGDPSPYKKKLMSIDGGNLCNLTGFFMCAHNATHIDAPYHFYNDGKTVDQLPLEKFVGYAVVLHCEDGIITQTEAGEILGKAKKLGGRNGSKKILIGGGCTISESAAKVFADEGLDLIGIEPQSVGNDDSTAMTHYVLLGKEVILLEGVRLKDVPEGKYFLAAQPLNLGGLDGAPCRAILIDK